MGGQLHNSFGSQFNEHPADLKFRTVAQTDCFHAGLSDDFFDFRFFMDDDSAFLQLVFERIRDFQFTANQMNSPGIAQQC